MDFLCPNCQKMLTVPDQYAGTLMKCPLCQNTFQAPALPTQQAPLAAAALPADVPPPPPAGGADVYGLKDPIMATPPPASAVPPPTSVAASTGSAPPALNRTMAPPPPLPPSTEHRGGFTIPFRPEVVPWIAPVCLVLVFLLTFAPWVGYYWSGHGMLTQGAWGALVGGYATPDLGLWQSVSGLTVDAAKAKEDSGLVYAPPGWNLILLPYLLLLLLALAAAVASVVLPRSQVRLPPQVEQYKDHRWALVAVLAGLGFVCLLLLWVLQFSMQHNAWAAAQKQAAVEKTNSDQEKDLRVGKNYDALGVQQTVWFRLALLLQLVATVAAALTWWVERQVAGRHPVPQLALRW